MKRRLKYRVLDWWELSRPSLTCRVFGHSKRPGVMKMGGEILCRRCRRQIGRWGV